VRKAFTCRSTASIRASAACVSSSDETARRRSSVAASDSESEVRSATVEFMGRRAEAKKGRGKPPTSPCRTLPSYKCAISLFEHGRHSETAVSRLGRIGEDRLTRERGPHLVVAE